MKNLKKELDKLNNYIEKKKSDLVKNYYLESREIKPIGIFGKNVFDEILYNDEITSDSKLVKHTHTSLQSNFKKLINENKEKFGREIYSKFDPETGELYWNLKEKRDILFDWFEDINLKEIYLYSEFRHSRALEGKRSKTLLNKQKNAKGIEVYNLKVGLDPTWIGVHKKYNDLDVEELGRNKRFVIAGFPYPEFEHEEVLNSSGGLVSKLIQNNNIVDFHYIAGKEDLKYKSNEELIQRFLRNPWSVFTPAGETCEFRN